MGKERKKSEMKKDCMIDEEVFREIGVDGGGCWNEREVDRWERKRIG